MGTTAKSTPTSPIERLQRHWRELRAAEPGERFKQRYRRKQREGRSPLRKALHIGVGLLLLAAGLVLMPAPGPGFVVVIVGAAILAQGSYAAAAFLDRVEIRARRWFAWGSRVWSGLPVAGKAVLVLAAACGAALLAWMAYRTFIA